MALGPIMVDLRVLTLAADEKIQLANPSVGGVIIFSRNYNSITQIKKLIATIHKINPELLIAVDQEGGKVQRFLKGFTKIPAMAKLGKEYDKNPAIAAKLAFAYGFVMAYELLKVGVDFSFTPVLDLDHKKSSVIGDRAFHHKPRVVIKLATSLVDGIHQAGMKCVGKHFPGHGFVSADSHYALPIDKRPMSAIKKDMLTFTKLIDHGLDAIMSAHIIYTNIDKKPAGFSQKWLKQILRSQIGFKGIVFSDDLFMQGAHFAGDMATRISTSLDSGCDMVIVCKHLKSVSAAFTQKWAKNDRLQIMRANKPANSTKTYYLQQLEIIKNCNLALV